MEEEEKDKGMEAITDFLSLKQAVSNYKDNFTLTVSDQKRLSDEFRRLKSSELDNENCIPVDADEGNVNLPCI